MTKRLVILSAKRERIRISLERRTDCRGAKAPRNDKEQGRRIDTRLAAVSPAGSVGASAPQRCPPDTRTAMTERLVILSDVASACGAGKSEQKEAPRSKVVRAPSE